MNVKACGRKKPDRSYHVVGAVSDWLVARRWHTLFGMSVAEAAPLHDQVIDGEVAGGKIFVHGGEVFGLARTRLALQQANPDVGHPELPLTLLPERIEGLPLWKAAIDHLVVREESKIRII